MAPGAGHFVPRQPEYILPRMNKLRRITVILLVNLLLLLLLVETAGLIVYQWREGAFFYTRPRTEGLAGADPMQRTAISTHLFQPFWGFSARVNLQMPRLKQATNNYGFITDVDYPVNRENDRQLIIGVFGGSVAAQFTWYGSRRLAEVLAEDPRFADREIRVLSFAGGGYKQPQQLQILTYFLSLGQPFDMVLAIDGFNEVALSPYNRRDGIDLVMPSATHFLPLVNLVDKATLTPERIDSLHRITRLRERQRAVEARLGCTWSAGYHLLLDAWRRRLETQHANESAHFQSLASGNTNSSLVALASRESPPADDHAMFELLVRHWAESSLLMHELCRARGIDYHHVLQPNQYHSGHAFGEKEAALALDEDSPVRSHAADGYPHLVARGPWLHDQGIGFHDATTIFDREPEPVYKDDCCHFNQLGNEILAEFIGGRILGTAP